MHGVTIAPKDDLRLPVGLARHRIECAGTDRGHPEILLQAQEIRVPRGEALREMTGEADPRERHGPGRRAVEDDGSENLERAPAAKRLLDENVGHVGEYERQSDEPRDPRKAWLLECDHPVESDQRVVPEIRAVGVQTNADHWSEAQQAVR